MTWILSLLVGIVCAVAPACAERLPTAPAGQPGNEAGKPVSARRGGESRVEVRDEWLYVDGEAFLVKGVGYSPARPGQVPWTMPVNLEVMAKDFAKIREAGFNTLRTWAPLTPEQLALAKHYGLMVLQGIWVDQRGNYLSEAFQNTMLDTVRKEVVRAARSDNVLAILIGNELLPERAYLAGFSQTDALLKLAYQTAKQAAAARLVSYANWPQLPALDFSIWDLVCLNLYPYEPVSVSHSLGFRGYLEYLKRTAAKHKPLIVTEVGLSVSPTSRRPGYGGHSEEEQALEGVKLWDTTFQAGAQGACIFEWNDEWWKQAEATGDEQTHDPEDPEEWFGITRFQSAGQTDPQPRPLYHALKAYNQAILLSPVSDEGYQERVPVTVYTTEAVASVRVRLGTQKWRTVIQLSPHWWKTQLLLPSARLPKQLRVTMEARGKDGKTLIRQERLIWTGLSEPPAMLTIQTDRDHHDVDGKLVSMPVGITVTKTTGEPLVDQEVWYSIAEPQEKTEQTFSARTDAEGRVSATYLLREPGLVTLAAGTPIDRVRPARRVGNLQWVVVERREPEVAATQATTPHHPSVWERRAAETIQKALSHATPAFGVFDPGTETVVDYTRYGRFEGVGTPRYHYEILDRKGLATAVGEGIYPNEQSLLRDPAYRAALEANQLTGSVWDFASHPNVALSFLKWADSSQESPGVKQFFTAMALERAGLLAHALKAYYAILVHVPDAVGWTEFQTPWYVGVVARDKIDAMLRLHPELGLRLDGAKVTVEHGFDSDVDNDVVMPSPGQLVRIPPESVNPPAQDLSQIGVAQDIGKGRVRLRQYANGHWQLLVDGTPWVIHGISYSIAAVGESHDEGTYQDWMTADRNHNGVLDAFDTFVDANHNNRQDADEPVVGDFQLLKEMGTNTLRLYHHASDKTVLRQLYDRYGMMVLMGDLVGMYTVGSGATWEAGTNYLDPAQRKRMTQSVKQMVRKFKHEPYILMWVLGNENNYGGEHGIVGGKGNAAQYPDAFYRFLNELAEWIHKEDPNHPVAIANGEWIFLDLIARDAPAIDVFGANLYRGSHGFGRSFFEAVHRVLDKPVFVSEFGCPAYQANASREVGELDQMLYHFGSWVDLEDNMAGRGAGNAIGGVVFEWVDEWWKAGQPPRFSSSMQETTGNWSGPFPGGKMYEEWLGIVGQGDGRLSPYLRQLRKTYELYKQLWNNP